MKRKSRIILPILTFLTFGMIVGSAVSSSLAFNNFNVADASSLNQGDNVFFVNKDDWGNPHIYVWGGTEEVAWPGTQLTDDDVVGKFEGHKIYKYTIKKTGSNKCKIHNNDGSEGTGDKDLGNKDNAYYNGNWYAYDGSYDPDQTKMYYFRKTTSSSWNSVYVYAWNDTYFGSKRENTTYASSPEVSYLGQYGSYYYYSYPLKNYYNKIILKSNSGDTPASKTADLYPFGYQAEHNAVNILDNNSTQMKDAQMEYYLGDSEPAASSANWTAMKDEEKSGYRANYYTNGTVDQDYNKKLFARFKFDTDVMKKFTASEMSLVTDDHNHNFTKDGNDATRPHTRFGNVNGFIDIRMKYENSALQLYVAGKGIYNGCFDVVVGSNTRGYYYYATTFHDSPNEWDKYWDVDDVPVYSGDSVKFLNSNNHYEDPYNPTEFYNTGGGIAAVEGVATCSIDGRYHIEVQKKNEYPSYPIEKIYTVRNTRNVTFHDNSGYIVPPATQIVDTGDYAEEPDEPEYTHYDFDGWFEEGSGTPWDFSSDTVDDDTDLFAEWSLHDYTIVYDLAGGSVATPNPTSYNIETASFTLTNPTREHYKFTGWTGTGLEDPTQTVTITSGSSGNRSYTATWQINQYTISFDSNGGSAVAPITQDYGSEVVAPDDPTRTGYTFTGWTPAVPSNMPGSNTECVAGWSINQYTITFNTNGATSGAISPITQNYGTAVTPPTDPTKTGYIFAGWFLDSGCTDYYTITTMPGQNITLYAKWINDFSPSFDILLTDQIGFKVRVPKSLYTGGIIDEIRIDELNETPGGAPTTVSYKHAAGGGSKAWIESGDDIYIFVDINAAQLTDYVNFRGYKGGAQVGNETRTNAAEVIASKLTAERTAHSDIPADYCRKGQMCMATLYYGDCVQRAMGYNTGRLPLDGTTYLSANEKAYITAKAATFTKLGGNSAVNNQPDHVKNVRMAGGFDVKMNFRILFTAGDGDTLAKYKATVTGPAADAEVGTPYLQYEQNADTNQVRITIHGIKYNDIKTRFTLSVYYDADNDDIVDEGETYYVLTYSINDYLCKINDNESPTNPYVKVAQSIEIFYAATQLPVGSHA